MSEIQIPWVQAGYAVFAYEGPNGLKIERLSRKVGKNKSSFYHLFADLEIFTGELLAYHIERSKIMAEKEADCTQLAELINVLVEHKVDLLFNRQLRIHREHPEFERCFLATNRVTLPAILPIWSKIISLEEKSSLSELVYRLSLENFFLQITDETLNPDWLANYFREIKSMVAQFKQVGRLPSLDGSV